MQIGDLPGKDQNAILDGIGYQAGGIMKVKLLHDVVTVRVYRPDADMQNLGNLLVGVSLGDKLQHFALASREARIGLRSSGPTFVRAGRLQIILQEDLGDRRTEEGMSGMNGLDCVVKIFGGAAL